jgi:hexosaminidase
MKFVVASLVAFTLAAAASVTPAQDFRTIPPLIPRPETINPIAGAELQLTRNFTIFVPDDSPEDRAVGEYLAQVIEEHLGVKLAVKGANRLDAAPGSIFLFSSPADKELGDEGYELTVRTNAIIISAGKPAGLFYAVQTLRQLLPIDAQGGEARVPCLRVMDRPRYPWRGFMLDCSRHFMSVDFIKRTLDLMAYHKLNRFHWHLTDAQGWRLQIDKYPKLTRIGAARDFDSPQREPAFYSRHDVREIVAYAKSRHITIVPEIEMPGHCDAALASYPELACDGGPGTFCAGREEVFDFLFGVLDETVEMFPDSPVIHIGGDERPKDVWGKCPRCQARMNELNITTEYELQTWFMRRITDHLKTAGRRAVTWAVTQTDPYDPKDMSDVGSAAIVQNWHGGAAFAAKQGWDVVNSDNRFVYFDYPTQPDPTKPKWMPVLDLEKVYSFEPAPPGLSPQESKHILGGEACLWTEFVPQEKVDAQMFPRLLALAEVVWSQGRKTEFRDFARRVEAHMARLKQMGVDAR